MFDLVVDFFLSCSFLILCKKGNHHWLDLIQVLVDAECTHDGSIKHIQKFEHWGWRTLQRRVLDAERTDSLTVLQVTNFNLIF